MNAVVSHVASSYGLVDEKVSFVEKIELPATHKKATKLVAMPMHVATSFFLLNACPSPASNSTVVPM